MNIPSEVRKKFYALRAVTVLFSVFGVIFIILWPHDLGLRSLGLVAIIISVWTLRRSNVSVWRARGQIGSDWSLASEAKRVTPLAWSLTATSLVACGICYYLMYLDALHGGKEAWPAYAFAGAGLALILTAGYVTMKIFR